MFFNYFLRLVIPAKTLVGGRTYTATVVVSMQQDQTLAVTQTATITAVASDVVAVVQGVQTISVRETITLDGSKSYDPDGSTKTKTYKWQILNMDDSAVISRTSRKRYIDDNFSK